MPKLHTLYLARHAPTHNTIGAEDVFVHQEVWVSHSTRSLEADVEDETASQRSYTEKQMLCLFKVTKARLRS